MLIFKIALLLGNYYILLRIFGSIAIILAFSENKSEETFIYALFLLILIAQLILIFKNWQNIKKLSITIIVGILLFKLIHIYIY